VDHPYGEQMDWLMMDPVLGKSFGEDPVYPIEAMFDKLKAKGFDRKAYRLGDKKLVAK
jgi:hypothetical protein